MKEGVSKESSSINYTKTPEHFVKEHNLVSSDHAIGVKIYLHKLTNILSFTKVFDFSPLNDRDGYLWRHSNKLQWLRIFITFEMIVTFYNDSDLDPT